MSSIFLQNPKNFQALYEKYYHKKLQLIMWQYSMQIHMYIYDLITTPLTVLVSRL